MENSFPNILRSLGSLSGETRGRLRASRWGLVALSLPVVAVVALPVAYLLLRAGGAGSTGIEYLLSERTLTIIAKSLAMAFSVAAASVAVGLPFAWMTTRTTLPLRRFWLVAGLLTMVIPSYLGAITFVEAFGPVGALRDLLAPLGVTRLPPVYGFFGTWVVMTLYTFPYVVLPVRAALSRIDPAQEEAARMLGLGRWRAFFRVTLPQLRPALAAGVLLSMLYTLSDFGVVMVLRYNAFTRAIFTSYNSTFDRERAALLALVLVALTAVLVWLDSRAVKSLPTYRHQGQSARKSSLIPLGRWTIPALFLFTMLVVVGVGIPVAVLSGWAFNPNITSTVPVELEHLAANSVAVSAITAIVVGLAALPLALMATRLTSRLSRMLVGISYIGNVLPGLVVGLALVHFAANYLPSIYQSIPLLVVGYAIRFLPYSVGATRSALAMISPRLDEAARTLGCTGWRATARITLPLARTGVFGGMALVALSAMKELPTTLMLSPIGFRNLATRAWTGYDSASYALVGAPGLLLLAVSALTLFVLLWQKE
ncbi:MAG: iron ABC transporter permease [Chloroflexi bacterium]|nr:iron ABC transporter permease [Chloroflexota bacterium]